MDFSQIYFSREARIGDSFSREMREMKNTDFVWNVYYFLWGEECSSPPAAYNAIHVMLIMAVLITYIVHQNKKKLVQGLSLSSLEVQEPFAYQIKWQIKSITMYYYNFSLLAAHFSREARNQSTARMREKFSPSSSLPPTPQCYVLLPFHGILCWLIRHLNQR